MIRIFFFLFLSCTYLNSSYAQENSTLTWYLNYDEVTQLAKKENKFVLLFFHGSDWCPPCIKMQKEVFANDTLIRELTEKILFLDVDFPYKKKLSEEQLNHNTALKKKFNLPDEFTQGYPQVVLIDGDGNVLYQEKGYSGGGPSYLLNKLKEAMQKKEKI